MTGKIRHKTAASAILLFLTFLSVLAMDISSTAIGQNAPSIIKRDREYLTRHGISTDPVKLLELLRSGTKRTFGAKQREKVTELFADLSSEKWITRENATTKLAAMGPGIQPYAAELLQSEDPELRRRAKLVLSSIRIGTAKKTGVFCAAARLLGAYPVTGADEVLLELFPIAEPQLKIAIIRAFASYQTEKTATALIETYKQDYSTFDLQVAIIEVLVDFSLDRATEFFLKIVADEKNPALKIYAISLCKKNKAFEKFIPVLIANLLDKDRAIRLQALFTLMIKTKKDFGEDHARWNIWWQNKIKERENIKPKQDAPKKNVKLLLTKFEQQI